MEYIFSWAWKFVVGKEKKIAEFGKATIFNLARITQLPKKILGDSLLHKIQNTLILCTSQYSMGRLELAGHISWTV